MLDDSLSLSEDQKARIRPIVAARQQELKAIAGDPSAGRLQRARKARSVLEESDRSIEALLTAEQQEKYRKVQDQIRGQAKERLQQRGSAGG